MIANSRNMKPDAVPYTASGKDISKGNTMVNTIFVADVFNTKHGLEELKEEELPDFAGMMEFMEGTKEERQFVLWLNSLDLDDTDLITALYREMRDGKILCRVCDKIKPGCIDWPATCGFPNSNQKTVRHEFDVAANCKQAFEGVEKVTSKKQMGLGAIDIQNANKGGNPREIKNQRQNLVALIW